MEKIKIQFVEGELDYLKNKTSLEMRKYIHAVAMGHNIDENILLYIYNVGYEKGKESSEKTLLKN